MPIGLLLKLLTFPVTGPVNGLLFVADKLAEQAENEMYNEDAVRAQLTELELRYDLGEIEEESFYEAEEELLDRLKMIRKRKEEGV